MRGRSSRRVEEAGEEFLPRVKMLPAIGFDREVCLEALAGKCYFSELSETLREWEDAGRLGPLP